MGTNRLLSVIASAGLLMSACGDSDPAAIPAPPPVTNEVTSVDDLFGLPLDEFADRVAELGLGPVRVGTIDGEEQALSADFVEGRVNVDIETDSGDDIVVDAFIEGDRGDGGPQVSTPTASIFGSVDNALVADLFGIPLPEFTDRTAERGLGPVRVGWRDGEFLAVNDDLSPGRVTVAIDSSSGTEIVVDASIEVPDEEDEPSAGEGPLDPTAEIRADLMVAAPAVAAAGQTIEVTYPGGRDRGVAYVLEVAGAASWTPTHWMTAGTDGYGGGPSWAEVGAAGYGFEDIGISGEGPDTLIVPDTAVPGSYRLCTENSLENICTPLIVSDSPADASIVGTTDGVAYYPACGNETLDFDGVTWYVIGFADFGVVDEMFSEQWAEVSAVEREASPVFGPNGFARVVEPGPGDDIGTLVVWSDGVGRWVSDSGDLDVWLVPNELEVLWDC